MFGAGVLIICGLSSPPESRSVCSGVSSGKRSRRTEMSVHSPTASRESPPGPSSRHATSSSIVTDLTDTVHGKHLLWPRA